MGGLMLAATYPEQYDRMVRWHSRFSALDRGQPHNVASDNYVDEVYAFFQNCYHLKDWIKNDDAVSTSAKQAVEPYINGSRSLKLCADICNSLKHLKLTKPRSGENPTFGGKNYSLAIGGSPSPSISLKFEVNTDTGTLDAFTLATECVDAWKTFLSTHGLI
jgi:hypothetical protein